MGKLGFPTEILDFQYNYSDNDIDQFNLHRFENKFKVNNFVVFVFYEETISLVITVILKIPLRTILMQVTVYHLKQEKIRKIILQSFII